MNVENLECSDNTIFILVQKLSIHLLSAMVSSSLDTKPKEDTMKIALDLDVKFQDGMLILSSGSGRSLMFSKDHVVPKKIQMVALAELSDLTIEQICQLFNYKTRKSYYDIRRWVLENKIEALMPKK
jgi:hypothetical protein